MRAVSDAGEIPPAGHTDDAFLGGRIRVLQPARGFRSGLDAVLLAAAIPASAGERALELGLGAGVAGLCVARRIAGAAVTGVEIDGDLVALARQNAARNGLAEHVEVVEGNVLLGVDPLARARFDHSFANPPYFEAGSALPAHGAQRSVARLSVPGTLARWTEFALRHTRLDGTVTFVHRADQAGALLSALSPEVGGLVLFPLWPKVGEPAKRVIVQGRKGSRAPLTVSPGLVLHNGDGRFTAAAEDILRGGAALAVR